MQHRTERYRAFTLIELLCVIGIIAALLALLLPSLAAARAEGYMAQCKANQHQLGIGYATYSINEHGYIPLTGNTGNADNYGQFAGAPYGTWHAWLPYGTYWASELYGPPTGTSGYPLFPTDHSTEVGIGFVYRYLAGENPKLGSGGDPVGKLFYCPGTSASFGKGPAYGDEFDGARSIFPSRAYYETWTYGFGTSPSMTDARLGGTQITYFYRNGAYQKKRGTVPVSISDWDYSFGRRSDDPNVFSKPMLCCFTTAGYGYPGQGGYPSWMAPYSSQGQQASWMAHGGNRVNLLWDDGSARTYKPGTISGRKINLGMTSISDSAWGVSGYSPYTGGGAGAAYGIMPYFWYMAEQGK